MIYLTYTEATESIYPQGITIKQEYTIDPPIRCWAVKLSDLNKRELEEIFKDKEIKELFSQKEIKEMLENANE